MRFSGKRRGEDIQPTSMSVNEPSGALDKAELSFSSSYAVSRLSGAELWKTCPSSRRDSPSSLSLKKISSGTASLFDRERAHPGVVAVLQTSIFW